MTSLLQSAGRLAAGCGRVVSAAFKPRSLPCRCVSYKSDPDYDSTPTPFKKARPFRYGYNLKHYDGGMLPRPDGEMENKPVSMPRWDPRKKDKWSTRKALFGQNDYIDILGDGSVHPTHTLGGPLWLRAFKGKEFQRIVRRLRFEGPMLREMYPDRYHSISKQLFYLYKKLNEKRHHAPYWGGARRAAYSRIEKIRDW